MSKARDRENHGHCLCGVVSVKAGNVSHQVDVCHCSMCRRWGGGPFMEVDGGKNVHFTGQQHIGVFRSSAWAERGYCRRCGTHLFYRIQGTQEYQIPVGLFDDLQDLVLDRQVFIDDKPDYYRFANSTTTMTGAEVYAAYAVDSDD